MRGLPPLLATASSRIVVDAIVKLVVVLAGLGVLALWSLGHRAAPTADAVPA